MGWFDIKKAKRKKAEWGIKREARKGAKRAKQIRKWKGEEVMFSAKADREEQRARLKAAKGGKRKKKSVTKGLSKKIGMRLW